MLNQQESIYKEINRLWLLFKITYGVAFIGSGVDKFCNVLVTWSHQGMPEYLHALGVAPISIMYLRGICEIIIGVLLLSRWVNPAAYSACGWLIASALYVAFIPDHIDTAARYGVVAVGAYALARLTVIKKKISQSPLSASMPAAK